MTVADGQEGMGQTATGTGVVGEGLEPAKVQDGQAGGGQHETGPHRDRAKQPKAGERVRSGPPIHQAGLILFFSSWALTRKRISRTSPAIPAIAPTQGM